MAFKKGQSGNPSGRPKGSTTTAKLRAAIEKHAPGIIAAMVEKAVDGDVSAAALLLNRVLPVLKSIEYVPPKEPEREKLDLSKVPHELLWEMLKYIEDPDQDSV